MRSTTVIWHEERCKACGWGMLVGLPVGLRTRPGAFWHPTRCPNPGCKSKDWSLAPATPRRAA
jgi:hypothetical protein